MDGTIDELARSLQLKLLSFPRSERLLVGIAGVPASGKTTIAHAIVAHLNRLLGKEESVVVGLDGWHYSRAKLDTMTDPGMAHARRGAHWTFDSEQFVAFARALQAEPQKTWRAPSFDHALKDPVEGDVEVRAEHRVVLFEGLYTFLSVEPWRGAGELMQERWFIDVNEEESLRRLVRRHVRTGVTPDAATARWTVRTRASAFTDARDLEPARPRIRWLIVFVGRLAMQSRDGRSVQSS